MKIKNTTITEQELEISHKEVRDALAKMYPEHQGTEQVARKRTK